MTPEPCPIMCRAEARDVSHMVRRRRVTGSSNSSYAISRTGVPRWFGWEMALKETSRLPPAATTRSAGSSTCPSSRASPWAVSAAPRAADVVGYPLQRGEGPARQVDRGALAGEGAGDGPADGAASPVDHG